MRFLITGGLGFVFSHVAEYFAEKHHVTVLDNVSDGSHPELIEEWDDIDVYQTNVKEIEWITGDYDVIIHAAAESNVDKSIGHQLTFANNNVIGTVHLLEWLRKKKQNHQRCPTLIYINTDEVYGSTEHWCEPHQATNPSNPYSASKAAAASFCWAYHKTYGLPVQEVRLCNIIGRRQAQTKLLPRIIERITNKQKMPVYDNGDFTREYMDVRDVAPLIEKVIYNGEQRIFNLTFNQEISILRMIAYVEGIIGRKAKIVQSTRAGHDAHYRMVPDEIILNEPMSIHKVTSTIRWMLDDA